MSTKEPARSRCPARRGKKGPTANARADGYTARRRPDDEEEVDDGRRGRERRQNGISNRTASILIPYSDAHSINIQLHQDRALRYPSCSPSFRIPSPRTRAHIPAGTRTFRRVREGRRKRDRQHRCVCTSAQSRQEYNNVCARPRLKSTPVGIDL